MESAQNDGNIFSKVFESSLTNALSPHVTAPLTVDKTMLVLGKIAYYIHAHKEYPVFDKKIIDIINSYCEEYGTKVNSVNFIATVVHARILSEYGEDGLYKFTNNNYLACESTKLCFNLCAHITAAILGNSTYYYKLNFQILFNSTIYQNLS